MAATFYVYLHKRKDNGSIFYVGKGCGYRLNSKQGRSDYWRRVVKKAGGYDAVKLFTTEDEELSYFVEAELIDKLKSIGVKLVNLSDGGEGGAAGAKRSCEFKKAISERQKGKPRPDVSIALKGMKKSEAHRNALRISKTGFKASEETKAKMSKTRIGKPSPMLGKKHSEEAKAKIGAAQKGEKNHWYGKKIPEHVKAAMLAANIGRVDSEETRRKKSESHKGENNWAFGRKIPEEQKQRQIASLKARPKLECPHCGKVCDQANAKRWHFENCKGER